MLVAQAVTSLASATGWTPGQLSGYCERAMGLNPQQREACFAPADQGLQVLAGAGTGKTLLITARTLHLLDGLQSRALPNAESRLLVLTFTDKAAQEMRERIHKHLRAAHYPGPLPSASIVTFHTFCNQFLMRHDLHSTQQTRTTAGMVMPSDRLTLLETAGQEQVHARLQQDIAHGLFANIQTALDDTGLSALGVSSDVLSLKHLKTWPVTEKMALLGSFAGLVEQIKSFGVTPAEFLTIVRGQTSDWTVATAFLPKTDPTTGLTIDDKEHLAALWATHLSQWADPSWVREAREPGLPYDAYKKILGDAYQKSGLIHTAASRKTRVVWNPDDPPALVELGTLTDLEHAMAQAVAAYDALYQQALRLQGALDFNDLINETILRLEGDEPLRQRYVDWFEHVLVDEFQDTNGAQLRLLRLLLKPAPTCNLTVVGDEKQSIYGFRYAQKENLSLIFAGYPPPKQVALQTNYRSCAPIVSVANKVSSLLTAGDAAQQLTSGIEQKTFRDGPAVTFFNLGRPLPPTSATGKPGRESSGRVQDREDRLMVADIVRLLTEECMQPSNIAILLPTHSRADSLASRLAEVGVPFLRTRDSAFFAEPTVRNATALLRLLADPGDQQALIRLLSLKLNQSQLFQLLRWLRLQALPPGQWLARLSTLTPHDLAPDDLSPDLPDPYRSALRELAMQLLHWQRQGQFVHPLMVMRQAMAQLELVDPLLPDSQRIQEGLTLRQFDGLLRQLIKPLGTGATLPALKLALEEAAARTDFKLDALVKDRTDSNLQAVRLLTFHASKGLEFEAVFVSWTHDATRRNRGQFTPLVFDPQIEGRPGFGLMWRKLEGFTLLKPMLHEAIWARPRRGAEAQRLFYVALTRAGQRLTVFRKDIPATEWTLPEGVNRLADVTLWDEQDPAHIDALETRWLSTSPATLRRRVEPHRDQWQGTTTETGAFGAGFGAGWNGLSGAPNRPIAPHTESASGLETLAACPTQYWWQHVARAPQPLSNSPPLLEETLGRLRGRLLHRAVEMAYQLPDSHPDWWFPSLWQEVAATPELPDGFDPALEIARSQHIFQTFSGSRYGWAAIRARSEQVIAPELPVHWQTPFVVETRLGTQPLVMTGRVDALFFNPAREQYTLVDFKTNARLSEGKRRAYAQQLALYQTALQVSNSTMRLDNSNVRLVHIPDGKLTELSLAELPHEPVEDWLVAQLPALSRVLSATTAPDPLIKSPPCQRCAYATLCPYKTDEDDKLRN